MDLGARARQQAAVAALGGRAHAVAELDTLMKDGVSLVAATLDVDYCKVLQLFADRDVFLLRAGVGWKDGSPSKAKGNRPARKTIC